MSCNISIVIPLYNTKKFIRQCVDSVLAQTFTNIEVIIVNDCSTDNGSALCEELYGSDKRVKIIHHDKNLGLGSARDTGTLHVSGRYVYYVDSDDEIIPDHLSNMFATALEYDADIVHNARMFSIMPKEDEPLLLEMLGLSEGSLFSFSPDHDELIEITLLTEYLNSRLTDWENHRYHFSAWGSMYKTSFLREHNITDTSFSRGKKTPESAVKAMRTRLEIVGLMKRITSKMPFFMNNEANTRRTIDMLLLSFEDGFVKSAFQSLSEDSMRNNESVRSFFAENFGKKLLTLSSWSANCTSYIRWW